jgi:hypothetical protein
VQKWDTADWIPTVRPRNITGRAEKPAHEPVWEISRIKGTPAAVLGRIRAPTAEDAIEKWAEAYGITDENQKSRLAARPMK